MSTDHLGTALRDLVDDVDGASSHLHVPRSCGPGADGVAARRASSRCSSRPASPPWSRSWSGPAVRRGPPYPQCGSMPTALPG